MLRLIKIPWYEIGNTFVKYSEIDLVRLISSQDHGLIRACVFSIDEADMVSFYEGGS